MTMSLPLMRPYAGNLPIENIDDKVMRAFIPWRRDFYADCRVLPKNAKRYPSIPTSTELTRIRLQSCIRCGCGNLTHKQD
jgi:hypothetical protein